jgi:hypothetical protein
MSIIQASSVTGSTGAYQIERSLRFNSADSAYLDRTPASASNRRTWTWSGWVKLTPQSNQRFFAARVDDSNRFVFAYANTQNAIAVLNVDSGVQTTWARVAALQRDPSAWYHFIVAFDSTQATATNRLTIYINGVEQAIDVDNRSSITQNYDGFVNDDIAHYIGSATTAAGNFSDYYLTEVNFIDGQALTPTSFGEFNSDTGVWQPKKYTGTYGTNGFYLNFSDNSGTTSTTLGADSSGNGNNWTPNNFSVTAGAGNDSLVDSPTRYGTDTGAGGEVRGNYATLNPLSLTYGTLSNGNLNYVGNGSNHDMIVSTVGQTTGKWYCEVTLTNAVSADQYSMGGVVNLNSYTPRYSPTYPGGNAASWGYYPDDGGNPGIYNNNARTDTLAAGATNDVIGMALDCDAGTLSWYKNNSLLITKTIGSGNWAFVVGHQTANCNINFGQRPFAYTAPSGFKALVTTNLPTPTIEDGSQYFDVALYTTNGSAQTITTNGNGNALQFTPDFLWNKGRNLVQSHYLANIVTGLGNTLSTDTTAAEAATGLFTAVSQGSFSMASEPAGRTKVTWLWKANGAGVTNTAGTITSTVSANTDSGFSIVTYTGTGANATVGHGLGVAPSMVIVKRRTGGIQNWIVWHTAIAANEYLYLNLTNAKATGAWNNTAPTSTVFSLDTATEYNATGSTYVAYCFAEVPGYSAFGSYTGNGSADGPFVYTGFLPRYVMIKRTSGTANWYVYDTARDPFNVVDLEIYPDTADAEFSDPAIDVVSNGFKLRNSKLSLSGNGDTYIYACFAENPFAYSLAR